MATTLTGTTDRPNQRTYIYGDNLSIRDPAAGPAQVFFSGYRPSSAIRWETLHGLWS